MACGKLRDDLRRGVISRRLGRRRRRSVIECPAALVVAAAARRGTGLEVVQEHSRPASRKVAQEPLQPLPVSVEGRGIADRDPRPRLDDLAAFSPSGRPGTAGASRHGARRSRPSTRGGRRPSPGCVRLRSTATESSPPARRASAIGFHRCFAASSSGTTTASTPLAFHAARNPGETRSIPTSTPRNEGCRLGRMGLAPRNQYAGESSEQESKTGHHVSRIAVHPWTYAPC